MTWQQMAMTSKSLEALVVREDSLIESLTDPKLELPINPKDKPKVAYSEVIKACP